MTTNRKSRSIGRWLAAGAAALITSLFLPSQVLAQAAAPKSGPESPITSQDKYRETINVNTITVMGASLTGSYIKVVDDIAKAVNDGHKLRVLPVVGEGGSQNIRDILYLKGVDAGLVKWNLLENYEKDPLFANLHNRLQYIALLFGEEFYIIGNLNIKTLKDLEGKKIGLHGGAMGSVPDLLKRLKVKPEQVVEVDFFAGMEQVKKGELDAVGRVTASPMKNFNERFDPKFHRIVPIPLDDTLIETHMPGKLTHAMYPKILAEGETVETVATGIVLAAYGWQPGTDHYRRVAQFTEAFFSNIDKLMANKDRHPGWSNVNLAADIPGWTRFPAAKEWLEKNKQKLPGANQTAAKTTKTSPAEAENIFREFQEWQQTKGKNSAR